MSKFTPLTVTGVSRHTRDSVVVTLAPPEAMRPAFGYLQGQYLTLRTVLDGEEVRRSYSICSAVQDQALQVGIKKVQSGRFSTWANETLKPGDQVEAMPPMGNFYTPLAPDNRKHYAGFAAGSGITPILGIAKTTLLTEPASSFSLFYGNRASSSIMFREALEDLRARCPVDHVDPELGPVVAAPRRLPAPLAGRTERVVSRASPCRSPGDGIGSQASVQGPPTCGRTSGPA